MQTRPLRVPIGCLLLLGAALLPACVEPSPVGRACFIEGVEPAQISISALSLECESRLCLAVGDGASPATEPGYCTATCAADDECEGVAEATCAGGFICAVPTVVGPFCCQRMCVCQDDLALLPIQPVPAACEASNPDNTCPNLPGRGEGAS